MFQKILMSEWNMASVSTKGNTVRQLNLQIIQWLKYTRCTQHYFLKTVFSKQLLCNKQGQSVHVNHVSQPNILKNEK